MLSVIGREENSERKVNSFQTRTLHRIKVTGIHKNTQGYTRIHKNTQEYTRIHRNTQGYTRIHKNTPEYTRIHKNTQEYTRIHRDKAKAKSFYTSAHFGISTCLPVNVLNLFLLLLVMIKAYQNERTINPIMVNCNTQTIFHKTSSVC